MYGSVGFMKSPGWISRNVYLHLTVRRTGCLKYDCSETGRRREQRVDDSIISSRQNLLHHLPVHIGQAVIAAAEAEGQAFMIQSHEVQDRGVQVMDVDFVFD